MSTAMLTQANVEALFGACLLQEGEDATSYVRVEGVTSQAVFHPERLAASRETVAAMLAELPEEFLQDNGGDSFVAANLNRSGAMWTDNYKQAEMLLMLGLGLSLAAFRLQDRRLWVALPAGEPIIGIRLS